MTTFQICVLNIQASSLVAFHDSDLKPYVVFLTPPSPNVYKMQKQQQGEVLKVDYSVEELRINRQVTFVHWCSPA
jgi:hypothetical protein